MQLRTVVGRVRKRTNEVLSLPVKRSKGGDLPKRICKEMLVFEIKEHVPACLWPIIIDLLESTEDLCARLLRTRFKAEGLEAAQPWRWMGRSMDDIRLDSVICVAPHLAGIALPNYPTPARRLDLFAAIVEGYCRGGHKDALLELWRTHPDETRETLRLGLGVHGAIRKGQTTILSIVRTEIGMIKEDRPTNIVDAIRHACMDGRWETLREARLHWGASRRHVRGLLRHALTLSHGTVELLRELHEGFGCTLEDFKLAMINFEREMDRNDPRLNLSTLLETQQRYGMTASDFPPQLIYAIPKLDDVRTVLVAFQFTHPDAINSLRALPRTRMCTSVVRALQGMRLHFNLTAQEARECNCLAVAIKVRDAATVRELRIGYGLDDWDSRALSSRLRTTARALCPDLAWPAPTTKRVLSSHSDLKSCDRQ